MSKSLLLYTKLIVSAPDDLGEEPLKFSVTINSQYAEMLEELVKRSGLPRAKLARILLNSALNEINDVYNLDNLKEVK